MLGSCKRSILFVTNNPNKVKEIEAILSKYDILVEASSIEKREIQSEHLEEIAKESALSAYRILKKPLFVEDSGLFIQALNGFPGPYSSYTYKKIGVVGILKLMAGEKNRAAEFVSQIAYVDESGVIRLCKGVCEGTIAEEARGSLGFGFDPIFIPKGHTKTFAEMVIEEKNRFSHRAKAAHLLAEMLLKECR